MKKIPIIVFLAAFLFPSIAMQAQEYPDSTKVVIETTDENTYVGLILSQDEKTINLKTETIGVIAIQKELIKSIAPVDESAIRSGEYWYENPYSTTRYFYNPSGYGLPAGEGYYQNTWVLMNQVSIGITDNISIGAGMIPLFLFGAGEGLSYTPVWLTPKFSIPIEKDKLNIGGGLLYLTIPSEKEGVGIMYGVTTFGPKHKNLTLGLGWGYATSEGIANKPTFSASFLNRGKRKWAFVTENYLINAGNNSVVLLSGGARHIGKKISIDLAGVTAIGDEIDANILIPWLSISVPFDVKKNAD